MHPMRHPQARSKRRSPPIGGTLERVDERTKNQWIFGAVVAVALVGWLGRLTNRVVSSDSSLNLVSLAIKPVTVKTIQQTNKLLSKKEKQPIPVPLVSPLGENLILSASKDSSIGKEAWGAAVHLMAYKSDLNAESVSLPANLAPFRPVGEEFDIATIEPHGLSAGSRFTFFKIAGDTVPLSEAARWEKLGSASNATTTAGPRVIIADFPGVGAKLDGYWLKNIILRESRVAYDGGHFYSIMLPS